MTRKLSILNMTRNHNRCERFKRERTLVIRDCLQNFSYEWNFIQTKRQQNCRCPLFFRHLSPYAFWCDIHVQIIWVKHQWSVKRVNQQTFSGGCCPTASWTEKNAKTSFCYKFHYLMKMLGSLGMLGMFRNILKRLLMCNLLYRS